MDPSLFARGLLIGFSIAAPVGPIGVLCIRRTLAHGWWDGLLSGLGAATADAAYGAVGAFGLTAVSALLVGQQVWLRLLGGLFLVYLGVTTFRSRPAGSAAASGDARGRAGMYLSTLGLTLTNPATIISLAAVFAGLGIGSTAGAGYASAGLVVVGVFGGSALWWLILATAVDRARGRMPSRSLAWVNRISGLILAGFGLLALGSLLR